MATISSDIIRGYNDLIVLKLLLDGPSYGYELAQRIKTITEEKYVIQETTLYSALTRLLKKSYVTSFSKEGDTGKRRTYYEITKEGISYYEEKCEEWVLTQDVIRRFV